MAPRVVTSIVLRNRNDSPPEEDWRDSSVEERIDAVWTLTKLCLAWNSAEFDEPRLQRSVSRVQRLSG